EELKAARGADRQLDAFVDRLASDLAEPADAEMRARSLVERIALALQGSLLARFGHPAVNAAFLRSRIGRERGKAVGTLPAGVATAGIIERSLQRLEIARSGAADR